MNSTVVRVSIYSGIVGLIAGTVLGVLLSRSDFQLPPPNDSNPLRDTRPAAGANQPSGGSFFQSFDLTDLTVPKNEILRGGPPKDGIPAITDPETVRASDVDFLDPDDRIVAITVNGASRAYPIRMLNWHEIVNDELGGIPVAVVYCPLCDSVSVVDRRVKGKTLSFGVSGLLYQSNVLMYDRQHDALWSQIMLEAVSGPYAGRSLRHYPWTITSFDQWNAEHSDGTVVTFNTGYGRDYSRNPYADYLTSDEIMFDVKRDDDRLDRKARVVGVRFGDSAIAYPLDAIHASSDGRLTDKIGGERIIIEADRETGRVAVIEAPDDARTIHTFWFSWAAVHPETKIHGKQESPPS